MPLGHEDECDKIQYEGGICTCELLGNDDYHDEPSNMAALENGETFGDLW